MLRRPIKFLVSLIVILILVIIVVLGLFLWKVDAVAQYAVETGATRGIGLSTRTQSVHLSLLTGNINVHQLSVANIAGYKSKSILENEKIAVNVNLASLLDETIVVPEIRIDHMQINMEQKGLRNNVSELMKELAKSAQSKDSDTADAPGKKLQIQRIVINDITAHVQLLPIGGKQSIVKVVVPQIILEDVSPKGAKAVAVAEVTRRILPAIIAAVLDKGQGVLPDDLTVAIGADLAGAVGAVGSEAGKLVNQAAKGLTQTILKDIPGALGKTVGGAAEKLGEGLEKGVKGVGEGIKDILDRDKQPK